MRTSDGASGVGRRAGRAGYWTRGSQARSAKGEAERFSAVYVEYKRNPDVTRRRLYLETVAEVLPLAGQKVIIDEAAKGMTPILQMRPGDTGVTTAAAAKESR